MSLHARLALEKVKALKACGGVKRVHGQEATEYCGGYVDGERVITVMTAYCLGDAIGDQLKYLLENGCDPDYVNPDALREVVDFLENLQFGGDASEIENTKMNVIDKCNECIAQLEKEE